MLKLPVYYFSLKVTKYINYNQTSFFKDMDQMLNMEIFGL